MPTQISQAAIQEEAYRLWLARGCPIGSPELDWLEAENLLQDSARLGQPAKMPEMPEMPDFTPYGLKLDPQARPSPAANQATRSAS